MRNIRSWIRPESPQQALEILRAHGPGAAYLGGGTRLAETDDPALQLLVDLEGLRLDLIEASPSGLKIGAMTRLEPLRLHPQARLVGSGILHAALGSTRTAIWRNQATLGGHLREAAAGDLVLMALLVLDAHVTLLSDPGADAEIVPIEALPLQDPTHLILDVEIPSSAGWRHATESLAHSAQDLPVLALGVGLLLLDGRIRAARVAASGSYGASERLHAVEAELSGAKVRMPLLARAQRALGAEAPPQADLRASAAYRGHLRQVLLARALRRVLAASAEDHGTGPRDSSAHGGG